MSLTTIAEIWLRRQSVNFSQISLMLSD